MSEVQKNESISSRKAPWKRVYAGTKKIFKEGKVLVTIVKE
jgi:hypothetical protein